MPSKKWVFHLNNSGRGEIVFSPKSDQDEDAYVEKLNSYIQKKPIIFIIIFGTRLKRINQYLSRGIKTTDSDIGEIFNTLQQFQEALSQLDQYHIKEISDWKNLKQQLSVVQKRLQNIHHLSHVNPNKFDSTFYPLVRY